ncbi:MAG: virulence factor SrfB [Clostridiales bacterium]|nr:virulence factor SrfB [Clostridiales bacterium]
MGGGTTDLVINEYRLDDGQGSNVSIIPDQRFRDGFKVAGDDILLDVIRQFILPPLGDALRRAGIPNVLNALGRCGRAWRDAGCAAAPGRQRGGRICGGRGGAGLVEYGHGRAGNPADSHGHARRVGGGPQQWRRQIEDAGKLIARTRDIGLRHHKIPLARGKRGRAVGGNIGEAGVLLRRAGRAADGDRESPGLARAQQEPVAEHMLCHNEAASGSRRRAADLADHRDIGRSAARQVSLAVVAGQAVRANQRKVVVKRRRPNRESVE